MADLVKRIADGEIFVRIGTSAFPGRRTCRKGSYHIIAPPHLRVEYFLLLALSFLLLVRSLFNLSTPQTNLSSGHFTVELRLTKSLSKDMSLGSAFLVSKSLIWKGGSAFNFSLISYLNLATITSCVGNTIAGEEAF